EAKAQKLEARVRELERAASERRRLSERATERRLVRPAAPTPTPLSLAPARGRQGVWALLELVTLASLVGFVLAHFGPAPAFLALIAGVAASQAFFSRLRGQRSEQSGLEGWRQWGAQTMPSPAPRPPEKVRAVLPLQRPRPAFGPPSSASLRS